MSTWSDVFLGVIAVATLIMAVVQIGVIIAAGRIARRVDRLADQVEREMKPLFAHLDALGKDASRAAGLAVAQVERVDRLFADLALRIEQSFANLQMAILGPAREGRALLAGLRAALAALRASADGGRGRPSRGEDEDALFI